MNRHLPHDLKQMQSLPLEAKIIMTQQRVRQWYEHWDGMVYVSFSGGKDSTVLKHIVDGMYDDVPSLFVNTGLEYPEIQRFAMSQPNVVTVRPEMRFDQVLKTYGYPVVSKEVSNTISGAKKNIQNGIYSLRLCKLGVKREEYGGLHDEGRYNYDKTMENSKFKSHKWRFLLDAPFDCSSYCCDVMKKAPAKKYGKETGRKPIIATMTSESNLRYTKWLQYGCNAFEKANPSSQPMSFWTEQDVLHYLKKYGVPYCSVYGDIVTKDADGNACEVTGELFGFIEQLNGPMELVATGCKRTGCIFCLFGITQEEEPNRFQRLKETHPRQYEYCIGGGEMVDGKWQPNKQGLGLGKVLDYIGVKYD